MTVWPDPKTEVQSLALRELAARLWEETDPIEIETLIDRLFDIVENQRRACPPN